LSLTHHSLAKINDDICDATAEKCYTPAHVQARVLCCIQHLGDPRLSEPLYVDLGHKS